MFFKGASDGGGTYGGGASNSGKWDIPLGYDGHRHLPTLENTSATSHCMRLTQSMKSLGNVSLQICHSF
jgi:hypothetical protein